MSPSKLHVFLLFPFLLLSFTTYSQTEVSGDVSGRWTIDGSPYLVTDTVVVQANDTLWIDPGVEVRFLNQDERETEFIVVGTLNALGTEDDSIRITSEGSFFSQLGQSHGYVDQARESHPTIRLHYCVLDSLRNGIRSYYGRLILHHTRVKANRGWSSHSIQDSITYSSISIDVVLCPSIIMQNNLETFIDASGSNFALPITGNSGGGVHVGGIEIEIYNNDDFSIIASNSNLHIFDNRLKRVSLDGCDVDIHDNYFNSHDRVPNFFELYNCSARIENNEIYTRHFVSLDLVGENNLVKNNLITSSLDCEAEYCDIVSNTILGSIFHARGNLLIKNNIIYTRNAMNGIFFDPGEGNWRPIEYNSFYGCESIMRRDEHNQYLGEGNFRADPFFASVDPFNQNYGDRLEFNANLLANSPCIDVGDPDLPLDPDGTRADIGAFFYDQSRNNSPILTSPIRMTIPYSSTLTYRATAIDDEGALNFQFLDLPDWFQHQGGELDWVSGASTLHFPSVRRGFQFNVVVMDDQGLTDTSLVQVGLEGVSTLAGVVTGTLHKELSPYIVVDNVIVPENDSLLIEPGVDIYFRYSGLETLPFQIKVYGKLNAIGTVEDSISVACEEEHSNNDPYSFHILSENDTSFFEYVDFSIVNGTGIFADSGSAAIVRNSDIRFLDSRICVLVKSNSFVKVDSCSFYENRSGYPIISVEDSSSLIATNSRFFYLDDVSFGKIDIENDCNVEFVNCEFDGFRITSENSQLELLNSKLSNESRVILEDGSTGLLSNNQFVQNSWVECLESTM
ncbi:right-handed parallel beta-helix repeat-containing protein, partial [bacterium]|nr:right-handed parallel beta-helix repeat-containing protein [bacterium]